MLLGYAPQDMSYIYTMVNRNKMPPPPPDEIVLIAFYNIKWILFTSQSSHMAVAMLQQSSVRSVGWSQDLHPEEQALDIIPFVWWKCVLLKTCNGTQLVWNREGLIINLLIQLEHDVVMRELLCMGWTDSNREEKNKETEEIRDREEDSKMWKDREWSISYWTVKHMLHSSETCTHMHMNVHCI